MVIGIYITGLLLLAIVIVALFVAMNLYKRAVDLNPQKETRDSLNAQIARLRADVAAKQNEYDLLLGDIANGKSTIKKAEEEKKWLDANQGKIETLKQTASHLEADLKDLNDKLGKQTAAKQALDQDVRDRTQEKLLLDGEIITRKLETDRLKASEKDLVGKVNRLTQQKNELTQKEAKLRGDVNDLERRKAPLEKEVKNLESQKTALQKELGDLNEIKWELDTLRTSKEKLNKEVKDLTQKKNELAQKEAELRGDVNDLERRKAPLEKEVKDLEAKEKRLKELKGSIAELEVKESSLNRFLKASEDVRGKIWEDLDNDVNLPNIQIKSHAKKLDEKEWLKEFEKNLKDCGILFNSRIIRAFHTGLKVADASPLLVLAGISGTGKSLLPELYARAAGMNFLQVAVQPRWDGPQDMFGFFNYMEGRFKATELSRLLWHSDKFNNPKSAQKHPGMNLVLLDEMNLARVEYYFSDMLSKLEVRRGIDPNKDVETRRAAEIVLDCGFGGNGNAERRRIFVGNNTLFVGTMNEDESTQMLSDKVVDRANIIRFGRPGDLNAFPKKDKFLRLYSSVGAMSEPMWNGLKSLPADNALVGVLNNINQTLSSVGRPFAYRTAAAIRSYVANYPQIDPAWGRHAFSDQIETKILPKLSGLDKQDGTVSAALNGLLNQIANRVDQELFQSFSEAIGRNEPFFRWSGVSR